MPKKTTKKATATKNFLVLNEDMEASCCGERFSTKELAIAEAGKHVNEGYNYSFFVVQLVAKVAPPEEVQAVVTAF